MNLAFGAQCFFMEQNLDFFFAESKNLIWEDSFGLSIQDLPLWMAGTHPKELSFVATAPANANLKIAKLFSPKGIDLSIKSPEKLVVPFDQEVFLGDFDLKLLPSGAGGGASLLKIKRGRRSLIYAENYCDDPNFHWQPAKLNSCDILVLNCFNSAKRQRRENIDQFLASLLKAIKENLSNKERVVLSCSYPMLTKVIVDFIHSKGIKVWAHRSLHDLKNKDYSLRDFPCLKINSKALGVHILPFHKKAWRQRRGDMIAICHREDWLSDYREKRIEPTFFPIFSTYNDYEKLIKKTRPSKIFLLGKYRLESYHLLKNQGLDVSILPQLARKSLF